MAVLNFILHITSLYTSLKKKLFSFICPQHGFTQTSISRRLSVVFRNMLCSPTSSQQVGTQVNDLISDLSTGRLSNHNASMLMHSASTRVSKCPWRISRKLKTHHMDSDLVVVKIFYAWDFYSLQKEGNLIVKLFTNSSSRVDQAAQKIQCLQ